ncbi:hypothetical protein L596_004973 [Steinernema carpocapsae]|uniref:Uncharacterized protein n=1 Tax=Steinernema carpocapsae TaxID=34508 RepID=A0A4U8V1P6_STECR|nr:hypothetical protein L596_004973 [Steinernema carpocapsae]
MHLKHETTIIITRPKQAKKCRPSSRRTNNRNDNLHSVTVRGTRSKQSNEKSTAVNKSSLLASLLLDQSTVGHDFRAKKTGRPKLTRC